MQSRRVGVQFILGMLLLLACATGAFADQAKWQVSKISGEVWIISPGVQKAALTSDAEVRAGDDIRTGRNGRVLLTRGEEAILISPNSALAMPESSKDGMATTIAQKLGSAVFQVEKRNVQHFQVETPYLAAVVKGTEFRVSVTPAGARVEVTRGAVDVSDFKSGQHAVVLPGQSARVAAIGNQGLSIRGPGQHSPILQGTPRTPGLNANTQRAAAPAIRSPQSALGRMDSTKPTTRISAPIGEMKLDYTKVTKGLAGSSSAANVPGRPGGSYWTSRDVKQAGTELPQGNSGSAGTGTSASGATATASASSSSGAASGSGGGISGGSSAVGGGSSPVGGAVNGGGNSPNGNACGLVGCVVNGVTRGLGGLLHH